MPKSSKNILSKEKLVKIIKSKIWWIQVFNGLPLYLHNVATNTGWMLKKLAKVNYSHFFLDLNGSRATYYYDEEDLAKIGYGFYAKNKTTKQIRAFETKHKNDFLKARVAANKLNPKQLNELSLGQLITLAQKISYELTMSIGMTHAIEGIAFVSEMKLEEILNKRNLNTSENLQLLSSPVKPSFISEAQVMLGEIHNANKTKKQQLINLFLKKFDWIESSYVEGKTLEAKDVIKKAENLKSENQDKALQKTKTNKAKFIRLLELSKQELFVIKTIEICIPWQDNRKKFLLQTIARFEPVIRELAKRLKLPIEQFKYIDPKELNYEHLTSQDFLRQLAKRYPRSSYYSTSRGTQIYSGSDAIYITKQIAKPKNGVTTELKGMVACRGIARGKARLCKNIYDIPKVKKGEILIASMTRPEFLLAMQKAAAFVTDEGGITSHAAIVSREMNKPCIIGTKIATEVFKNGEMLEVDANKGIVRKI